MGRHDKQGGTGRRRRRRFTDEFKRDAVDLVVSTGRPITDVADELGLYDSTLGNWVRHRQVNDGEREGTTSSDAARIRELEAELKQVRSERDLLKRSVAFWVKETSTW